MKIEIDLDIEKIAQIISDKIQEEIIADIDNYYNVILETEEIAEIVSPIKEEVKERLAEELKTNPDNLFERMKERMIAALSK